MARFDRERSDADWYLGLPVPAVVLRNIDEKTKKAVAETGGSWAPTTPIQIAGAGMEFQCSVRFEGSGVLVPAAGKVFRFGADDYFTHDPIHALSATHGPGIKRDRVNSFLNLLTRLSSLPREATAAVGADDTAQPAMLTRRPGAFIRFPLLLPDGARLESVNINFRVGQAHAEPPELMPRARVVRIDRDGVVTPYPLLLALMNASADGWLTPTDLVTGAQWYNSGLQKNFPTFLFDPLNGPRADRSIYDYALEWHEERGANTFTNGAGNYLMNMIVRYWMADLRPY